ncbi:MAG: hypothetical protein M3252_08095, partial [Actinomycetota bacterium]|nr:hypothetical protein [Actinomycetota bacterium]
MFWILAVVVALAIAVVFDPKWVLAPLLGYAIFRSGTAMLRGMAEGGPSRADPPEPVMNRPERTLYSCEQCGVELLLVVRGADIPPRHCGERMHERIELVH